jgi:PLD-like domain
MADDIDRADDWTTAPERLLDMRYEHQMQDAIEWLDEGRFISQEWFHNGDPHSVVRLSTKRPLVVHTYCRGENHESFAHDAHPLVAFVHLLEQAPSHTDVFISMPFFTDFSVIDHLVHYAKGGMEGGHDLRIKIIFGPEPLNKSELQRFIGESRSGYEAVKRLAIRVYNICHTPGKPGKIMHSKTMITATAGMTGSYNYTYGSRFLHGEDGIVFEDKDMLEMYRKVFESVWDKATPVDLQEPEDRSKKRPAEDLEQIDGETKFGME